MSATTRTHATPLPGQLARSLRRWQLRALLQLRYHRRTRSTAVRILLAKERHNSGVTFDFLSASFRADPYPSYRRLQAQDPVHWSELARGWVCTDPAHLEAAFQDARLSSNRFRVQGFNDLLDAVGAGRLASRSIMAGVVGQDPPARASARSQVAPPFTPVRADALRPRIDRIAERLLDDADRGRQPGQPLDLVAALADPLPTRVIAEILGLPADDHLRLKRWSDDMYAITDAVTNPAILARSDRAFAEFDAYLRRQIAARRDHPTPDHQPTEDILSSLVDAQRAGQISHEQLVGDMGFILSAGREGAACLIANALLALLQHPEQLAHLRTTPSAIPGAVEETIR